MVSSTGPPIVAPEGLHGSGKGILEVGLNHFCDESLFAMATLLDFRLLSKKYENVLTNKYMIHCVLVSD